MTREQASEWMACAFLKINEPKMRTVQSICLGGVQPDGTDGASDLTRCCIETLRELKLPYPNVSVRFNEDISPAWLLEESVKTIQVGFGMPMILNDRQWVDNLTRIGYPPEIAREYYNMGCVETMIQGRQSNWIGSGGANFPQLLLELLGKVQAEQIELPDFNAFFQLYLSEMLKSMDQSHTSGAKHYARIQELNTDPFASCMIEDCLEKGKDLFQGGSALAPHFAMGGNGLGTASDSLSAIRTFVFEQKRFTLAQLSDMLQNNFRGEESMRTLMEQQTPAYGNDLDEVDSLSKQIFDAFNERVFSYNQDPPAVDPVSGKAMPRYVSVFFSYNSHVSIGEVTGATPNGRRKGKPISECCGPTQGKDVHGPTKMLNSALKLDFSKVTGAFAFNVKVNPSWAQKASGRLILTSLIHSWLQGGGPQMQFNMQKLEDLRAAQVRPELHRDIVVRIAGYCEYFVNLDTQLQNEIISRTEHELAS
jgi:formate C-acetyltransferase